MAAQDSQPNQASGSDTETAMAERRGRRLNLSCRLFLFGEDDFEGEATILYLSTNSCQATSLTDVQVGMVPRLPLFLGRPGMACAHRRSPGALGGTNFGLKFTGIRST